MPPPHTVAHLSGGVIDGYCVGEPWNQRSVVLGIGRVALSGLDIWKGMPEKVLGTTEAWAEKNPETLKALIKALLEACQWLDEPENRAEAARLLASPRYLNTPAEVIARTLDLPDFHLFHRDHANFPWRSHADWFLKQMVRWGQTALSEAALRTAMAVFRPDLYDAALGHIGGDKGAPGEPFGAFAGPVRNAWARTSISVQRRPSCRKASRLAMVGSLPASRRACSSSLRSRSSALG